MGLPDCLIVLVSQRGDLRKCSNNHPRKPKRQTREGLPLASRNPWAPKFRVRSRTRLKPEADDPAFAVSLSHADFFRFRQGLGELAVSHLIVSKDDVRLERLRRGIGDRRFGQLRQAAYGALGNQIRANVTGTV